MVITNSEVRRIRKSYETGKFTQTQLAQRFGISQQHVSKLVLLQRRPDVR